MGHLVGSADGFDDGVLGLMDGLSCALISMWVVVLYQEVSSQVYAWSMVLVFSHIPWRLA